MSNALNERTTNTYNDAGNSISVKLADNMVTTSSFDAAGRLFKVVQGALNATTLFKYDASNRLVMTEDPTGVRAWMLYDEAGRKVADIDGNGTLAEYVYNNNDLVTHTIVYSTAVDVAQLVGSDGEPTAHRSNRPPGSQRAVDQHTCVPTTGKSPARTRFARCRDAAVRRKPHEWSQREIRTA